MGDVRCDVHISKGSKTFRCSSAHLNVPSGSARFTHPSAESSQHGEAVVYILNVCVRPLFGGPHTHLPPLAEATDV